MLSTNNYIVFSCIHKILLYYFSSKKLLKVTGYSLLINFHEKILPSFSSCRIQACMRLTLLYLNSTKTGAGRLEEFSLRRLTVFDIHLDLVIDTNIVSMI